MIGFLHREPGNLPSVRCEQSEDGKKKLEDFRAFAQKKMCRFWESPADLGSQVSRSLVKLIKSSPGIGWVRADLVPSESAAKEILQLKEQVEALKTRLESVRTTAPEGSGKLQRGDDHFEISYSFVASPDNYRSHGTSYSATIEISWDNIFAAVAPSMIDEVDDITFKNSLVRLVQRRATPELQENKATKGKQLMDFNVTPEVFSTVKVQLRALGLISKSDKNRSLKDTKTYWTLTPYGDNVMTRLLAIPRSEALPSALDSQ